MVGYFMVTKTAFKNLQHIFELICGYLGRGWRTAIFFLALVMRKGLRTNCPAAASYSDTEENLSFCTLHNVKYYYVFSDDEASVVDPDPVDP
jgi:hypothetical protein